MACLSVNLPHPHLLIGLRSINSVEADSERDFVLIIIVSACLLLGTGRFQVIIIDTPTQAFFSKTNPRSFSSQFLLPHISFCTHFSSGYFFCFSLKHAFLWCLPILTFFLPSAIPSSTFSLCIRLSLFKLTIPVLSSRAQDRARADIVHRLSHVFDPLWLKFFGSLVPHFQFCCSSFLCFLTRWLSVDQRRIKTCGPSSQPYSVTSTYQKRNAHRSSSTRQALHSHRLLRLYFCHFDALCKLLC